MHKVFKVEETNCVGKNVNVVASPLYTFYILLWTLDPPRGSLDVGYLFVIQSGNFKD